MNTRLIIGEDSVYEIDELCMQRKGRAADESEEISSRKRQRRTPEERTDQKIIQETERRMGQEVGRRDERRTARENGRRDERRTGQRTGQRTGRINGPQRGR